ncbi:hypothetical protein I317_04797 [Kwoniella heveanensis CBS 569]|nr:hypothetical protein I317_04797 [Kwoniella heveanensis CBS 569]
MGTTSQSSLLTPPDSAPPTPVKSAFQLDSSSSDFDLDHDEESTPVLVARPEQPRSLANTLYSFTDAFTSTVASSLFSLSSLPPVVAATKFAILTAMSSSITMGQLRIITPDQEVHVFPSPEKRSGVQADMDDRQTAEIRVLRDSFWLRLVAQGDLGFAEAYMAGDCEVTDLVQVFRIFIRSQQSLESSHISGVRTLPSRAFSIVTNLTNSRFANTISNSICNISAHYDLSNGMFKSFLSRDMTYSCAIFPELDKDLTEGRHQDRPKKKGLIGLGNGNGVDGEGDELEEAQIAKLRHIIRKADIRPGHRVLEIGSGWGSLAIEAVKMTKCTVDTITLSAQQKALAEKRIKRAGLAGRIRVHLVDYRKLPESWKGSFDRVVSIEMLEAVGKEFIPGYFGVLNEMLNESGVACIQVITIPESRFERYQRDVDFIQKWIFPGGFLPTVTYVVDAATKGSSNKLVLDSVSNIGPHYARTLREWRYRFVDNFDEMIIPALLSEHPGMNDQDVQVFKRKWIYYFAYCEIGFAERVLGDHIFTWVREGYADYGCSTYV